MQRLCGGYAEVMRRLCGYAAKNLQLGKALHRMHLCRGYAEVMRRLLFCSGCIQKILRRGYAEVLLRLYAAQTPHSAYTAFNVEVMQ